jgi:hypothetical protein
MDFFYSPLGDGNPVFTILAMLALIVVGVSGWVALAVSRFMKGGNGDMTNRVPHLYGYSVCLVAVITGLFCTASVIRGLFNLSNPLRGDMERFSVSASLTSFEAYRATYQRELMFRGNRDAKPDTLPDAELRARYEALKADRIAGARFEAARSITTSAILLLLAVGLFGWHWRWLKLQTG